MLSDDESKIDWNLMLFARRILLDLTETGLISTVSSCGGVQKTLSVNVNW